MTRSHFGSIERLGEGRYRVEAELGRDANGKRKRMRKVVRGTRDDAERVLAKMRLDAGKPIDTDMTVEQYWHSFYEPTLESLAPTTEYGYRREWERRVGPMFGGMKLSELKARTIEAKLASVEKPGAQENAFKLLRQIVTSAYRDELIESNPFDRRIRRKRKEHYEPKLLTPDMVEPWCRSIRGTPYEAALLLMLFGGLRREEAVALWWKDIICDGDFAVVNVDKSLTEAGGKLFDGPTKTAKSTRTVFIAGYAAERLKELSKAPEDAVCADSNGSRLSPNTLTKRYKAIMPDELYIPPRNLRTSYATMQQGIGVSDSVISRTLGHSQLTIDYDHYFATNKLAYAAAAKALADSLNVDSCHWEDGGGADPEGVPPFSPTE